MVLLRQKGDKTENMSIVKEGGEKVKPYLEVKIVKVKKEEKSCNAEFICPICNKVLHHEDEPEKKGNWVNGENLDKIKFPCFCSFEDIRGRKYYGMINKDFKDDIDTISYNLVEISKQDDCVNAIWDYDSLEDLFKHGKNIHILKGRIILFEEE